MECPMLAIDNMKPPQYEEMDHGRELAIPMAFDKYCDHLKRFYLVEIPPPQHPSGWCGPIPRPTYEVHEISGADLVAEFFPNGYYKCHRPDFEPTYRKMVELVERSGQEAYDRFLEEYERRRQL
jgi:hypothetical protein